MNQKNHTRAPRIKLGESHRVGARRTTFSVLPFFNKMIMPTAVFYAGLVFMFFMSDSLLGQQIFTLKGKVVDVETRVAIPGANIYDVRLETGTSTDKNGIFKWDIGSLPTELEVTFVGYEKLVLTIDEIMDEEITVFIKPAIDDLPEAVVKAERQPKKVHQKRYSVLDFEFYGPNILLLIQDYDKKNTRLDLLSPAEQVIDSFILDGLSGGLSLHKTCLGDINIIDGKNVHQVVMQEDFILGLGQTTPWETYDWEVKKCLLANEKYVYYQLYSFADQWIDYHLFAKNRDTNFVFSTVYNARQIQLFYEDMLPLLKLDHLTAAMEAENREALAKIRDVQETLDARMQFFYQPIYCPLFQHKLSLVLFDHLAGTLVFYEENGTRTGQVPITYHRERFWEELIIQDELTEKLYTFFSTKTGKHLSEINVEDGTLGAPDYFAANAVKKMGALGGKLFILDAEKDPVFGFTVYKMKILNLQ